MSKKMGRETRSEASDEHAMDELPSRRWVSTTTTRCESFLIVPMSCRHSEYLEHTEKSKTRFMRGAINDSDALSCQNCEYLT